jgi:hypothetical protein
LENGKVVDDTELIQNQEWKSGLQMEEKLHAELVSFVTRETTFEELYYHMNEFIVGLLSDTHLPLERMIIQRDCCFM